MNNITWISHRGNLRGPEPDLENAPAYIDTALGHGFQVEVDVWYIDGAYVLGHDEPIYEVQRRFLERKGVWCHAKNAQALHELLTPFACHCFWHENDRMTTTSHGFIWHFPTNRDLTPRSIIVLPESGYKDDKLPKKCYGICSDFVQKYKQHYLSDGLYFT